MRPLDPPTMKQRQPLNPPEVSDPDSLEHVQAALRQVAEIGQVDDRYLERLRMTMAVVTGMLSNAVEAGNAHAHPDIFANRACTLADAVLTELGR